jgi:hypothetical protein
MAEQKPMPEWIKNLIVPDSTKQYLYNRWLNGEISEKTSPQDWGAITDVIEFFKNPPAWLAKDEFVPEEIVTEKLDLAQITKDLKAAQNALDEGVTNLKYKNDVYSLTRVRDELLPQLKGLKKQAENQERQQKTALRVAKFQLDKASADFESGKIEEKELRDAQQVLKKVQAGELATLVLPKSGEAQTVRENKSTIEFIADKPAPTVTPKVTGTPTAILSQQGRAAAVAPMEDRAEQARFTRMQPTQKGTVTGAVGTGAAGAGTGTGGVGAGAGTATGGAGAGAGVVVAPVVDVAKRKTFVNAQLAARGLENTPANREILRKEYKTAVAEGKAPEAAAVSNAWETIIREQFPAKAWLLDLDRTKYPQLFKVLSTAIAEESYKTPEGRARFEAQLEGTEFYKEISTSKQLKTIQSLVGTLGFQGTDFSKFVSDSINFGYEGDILKQKVYEQVFQKDDANNYINPTALKRVKESADYIRTQNIAKSFFGNPSDDDIEQVLTGQILPADYERQQRVFAGQRYGHLKDLLDQGMTMKSIAANYKTSAARLLELDENAIDMSTGAFEQAVSFGEEGKKRLMTNSEWEKLLRSDPQYGWERTNNAKDEARALSANIAQAFGKII